MLAKLKAIFSRAGLARRIWQVANLLAAALLVLAIVQFFLHYRSVGNDLMEQGRRVEISAPDGLIKSRETLAALKAVPEEDIAKKHEEAFEKQAAGEGAVTGTEQPMDETDAMKQAQQEKAAGEGVAAEAPPETPAAEVGTETPAVPAAEPPAPAVAEKAPVSDPKLAIVITGVGLSRSTLDMVITLPANVTMSISPYAAKVADVVKEVHGQGYEVLLDIPLEPADYPLSDPGPLALLTASSEKQNLDQLTALLSLSEEVTGLVAPVDEQFTYSVKSISPVLGVMAEKKMPLYYAAKPGNQFLTAAAEQLGAQVVPYQTVLDERLAVDAITAQLNAAAGRAKETGFAVAVGRPYPMTVETINKWLASPAARDVRIVSLREEKAKEAPKQENSKEETPKEQTDAEEQKQPEGQPEEPASHATE